MSDNNTFFNSKYASDFSPANLAGLAVWLNADDSNSVTQSAGVVSSWTDQSPNALNMSQATAGSRPTIESNVQNGRPALRFTTTQMLQSTANLTLAPDQTWFVSFRPLAGTNMIFIEHGPNVNTTNGSYFYGSNNALVQISRSVGGFRTIFDASGVGATVFPVGSWYIASVVNSNVTNVQSNDVYWSINGARRNTTIDSNLLTGSVANVLYINPTSRVPGSNYTGEIIIYNRALTYGEVLLVERYLSYKWGVSLPTQHPFSSTPAVMRLFNPLDISGLSTWFDAADTRRMTLSGSNVNSWGDKANLDNSMNFVGTAGTLVSNASNYPCVRFSGTSRYQSTLSNLTRAAYFSDVSTFTMFATVNTSSTSGVNGLFWNFVSTTNVANRVAIFTTPPSTLFWDGAQQANPRQTGLTLTTNSIRLYMFRRSGLTLSFREFGTLTTSNFAATAATIANESYRITMSESGAAWTGDMHEILWYNRALPDTDIWRLEVYLAEKWGLRSSLTTNVPPRFTRALSPVFNPALISNCAFWLDSADYSTFTFSSDTVVSQWRDKSGNGRNYTQATALNQPTYGTFLSRPGVSFVGSSSQRLSNSYIQTGNGGRNTFIVFYDVATTANVYGNPPLLYMATTNNVARGDWRAAFDGANNYLGIDVNSGAYIYRTSPAVTTMRSERCIGMWGYKTGTGINTAYVYGNGVQFTTLVASAASTSALNVQNLGVTSLGGNGTFVTSVISEVIHYSAELTTAERQLVEGYLARKWNIPLLNSHPYKTTPV